MYAWGNNAAGQLGAGHLRAVDTPTRVIIDGDMQAVAAGASHSLALTEAGEVRAWGSNKAITQLVALGAVEEWTIVNMNNIRHPFHIHVNPMYIVAVNGTRLAEPYWADTIPLQHQPAAARLRRSAYAYVDHVPDALHPFHRTLRDALPHARARGYGHDAGCDGCLMLIPSR